MKTFLSLQVLASAVLGASISGKVARQTGAQPWQPAVGDKIQMILSGTVVASSGLVPRGVSIFDVDLFDTPASTVSDLLSQGIKVICYFSAGTSEDWRPDYSEFTSSDKGASLPDWKGENYLNLRSANVLRVMKARIQKASEQGCNAIDPDNMGTLRSHSSSKDLD